MPTENFKLRNPLKVFGYNDEDILPKGGIGAVLARAGIGKTSFLVQIAITAMHGNKNVLHVSLDDSVKKISIWYKEVYHHISEQYGIQEENRNWERVLSHRFILTLKVDGFSIPRLEERLNDLTEQDIFSPDIILIDGYPFEEQPEETLADLKRIADKYSARIWFTVRTHRHEDTGPDDIPVWFKHIESLFDVIIQLKPDGEKIHVRNLSKDALQSKKSLLFLDPSTMLLKESK